MNAPLLPRLIKPILGGGEVEPRIFASSGEGTGLLAIAPLALPAVEGLPSPGPVFTFQPGPATQVEEEPAKPALAAPRQDEQPIQPAPPATPQPAALPAPPALPLPSERIIVESLGLGALRVTGTSGGDLLVGGPGDDRLDGRAGDDVFLGSPGRDLFYGGAGHDTIRYDLLRAEVSLDTRFQRISLEDGEDQYDGIEVIDLRDGDWILTVGDPAALVQRLFLAATGQAPSAVEMIREAAALQAGGTAEALAARLGAGAGEAVQQRLQAALDAPREGKLDQPVWLPDVEALLLTRMADLALGGTPGRDAFLHWLDELEAGVAPDAVAAEMLATPEGRAHAPQAEAHALALAALHWML